MPDELERLFVTIEGDTSKLLDDAREGVTKTKQELGELDKSAKKTEGAFDRLGKIGKASFAAITLAVGAATGAVLALAGGIQRAYAAAQEGAQSLRTRSGFNALAASAGQSSKEILAAMREASGGVVSDANLMLAANQALQLGVAKTPEEFAKLTNSAILLGRAMGRGPVEALGDLINAAGRRSVEVLDNLGISLASVNQRMETMAQQQFGQTVDSLDQAQRNGLFMQAAIDEAAASASKLAGNVDDAAAAMDRATAAADNLKSGLNEAFTLFFAQSADIGTTMFAALFGEKGIIPLFQEGSNYLAQFFASLIAGFTAVPATIAEQVIRAKKVMQGQLGLGEFLAGGTPAGLIAQYIDNYAQGYQHLQEKFSEIINPGSTSAPVTPPGLPPPDEVDDATEELLVKYKDYYAELLDLQAESETKLENEASKHNDALLQIENDYLEKRFAAGQKLAKDLAKVTADGEKDRLKAIADAKKATDKLEAESREDIAKAENDNNREAARRLEDHIRAMNALRRSYLEDLTGLVEQRDAGAIVDRMRQYKRQQADLAENYKTQEDRRQEDANQELQEVRERNQKRQAEIDTGLQEELAAIAANEREKRAELRAGYNEELQQLDDARNEQLTKENQKWAEIQAEINNALQARLADYSKALARETELEQEHGQALLEQLGKQFLGEDGALSIIQEYVDRRNELLAATEAFKPKLTGAAPSTGGGGGGGKMLKSIPGFATGGTLLATRPTLAMFGEAGPEVAQFTPLSMINTTRSERSSEMKLSVDLNFRGDVPGNLTGDDKNKIAAVLVEALREAGMGR